MFRPSLTTSISLPARPWPLSPSQPVTASLRLYSEPTTPAPPSTRSARLHDGVHDVLIEGVRRQHHVQRRMLQLQRPRPAPTDPQRAQRTRISQSRPGRLMPSKGEQVTLQAGHDLLGPPA